MRATRVTRSRRLRPQRGAVAIIVGLSLAALIGFVGLALDLGKLYIAKTELQNSADACALAAARELRGTSENQLEIAEAAGITAGSANRVMFQREPVALTINNSVQFSDAPFDPDDPAGSGFEPKTGFSSATPVTPTQVKYVRCTATRSDIANWFIQVLNILPGADIGNQAVSALAVASLAPAQTNCAIPVSLCEPDATETPWPVGKWLEAAIGPGGESMTGNFKWIDFTPPGGGASELGSLLKGAGACSVPSIGAEIGQPGEVASLADEWNSRFGIYKGSTTPASAVPDFTGYAYTDAATSWPSKFGAYADFVSRRTDNDEYQGNTPTGLKINGTIKDDDYLREHGADRRLAIVPIVNCKDFESGSTAPVKSWACILMLHPINNSAGGGATGSTRMFLEYLGVANDAASPCATLGLPGSVDSAGPLVPVLVQ